MEELQLERVDNMLLLKEDNNLDKKDNLNELPTTSAVYGIFGRINGEVANCRFVGKSQNLQAAIKQHFSDEEPDACLRTFMQSIKIKAVSYVITTDQSEEAIEGELASWKKKFDPQCNEELNKVY